MDEWLPVLGSARMVGFDEILCAMLVSFVLCSVFAAVYRWTFRGLSYSRAFVQTLILGGMIVSMLIMAIGNNLARGLGILGTLAVIRFRTPIRDPRDMVFLFACFGVGIACGAQVYSVAILGTAAVCAAALFLHWTPFTSRREYEGMLRFALPPNTESGDRVAEILRACCSAYELIAMREAAQGDLVEYSYHVRLADPTYRSDLVDDLRNVPGVMEPSLLMHRATVEL